MADIWNDTQDPEDDTQKDRYLAFALGSESYGIEIRYVIEIIGIQKITEIPELPVYVKGIINLRGRIIPVIDIRLRFKKEPEAYNDRTCVIVVEMKELLIGLIVDRVAEVLTIPEAETVDPPQMNMSYSNRYIKKIGKVGNEVKLLLDCEKLLTENELEDISEAI